MATSAPTTRRSLLKAAPAAAIMATIPVTAMALPTSNRAAWDAAMKRYLDAQAAMVDYEQRVVNPAQAREMAFERSHGLKPGEPGYWERKDALRARFDYQTPEDVWEQSEALSNAHTAAEDCLLKMPAPDRAALCWKLDCVLKPDAAGTISAWNADELHQTFADYRRLLGDA